MEHPQVVIGDSRGGNVRLFAFVDFIGIGGQNSHKPASTGDHCLLHANSDRTVAASGGQPFSAGMRAGAGSIVRLHFSTGSVIIAVRRLQAHPNPSAGPFHGEFPGVVAIHAQAGRSGVPAIFAGSTRDLFKCDTWAKGVP